MSTSHIGAAKGQIAKKILLPGDPLRAKYIADTYLEDVICFNKIRNMYGFTGRYKGEKVSVMGTGMGIPSIGIYSHELIKDFGVEELIRIGSCGSYQEDIGLNDLILVQGASTDSSYAHQLGLKGTYCALSSYQLLARAEKQARSKGLAYHVGGVLSADVFYDDDEKAWEAWKDMGVLGVEMEAYGLFVNASKLGAKALAILTVSDSFITGEKLSPLDREKSFNSMMEVALDL